jgi:hypothetical protein
MPLALLPWMRVPEPLRPVRVLVQPMLPLGLASTLDLLVALRHRA